MIRSPNRTRRIAKWGGVAVCVLIAVVWIVSIFHDFGFMDRHIMVGFDRGNIIAGQPPQWFGFADGSWAEEAPQFERYWLPTYFFGGAGSGVIIPLWLLLLLTFIPTFILWRRDRIPPGHCQRCGYDLTGNVSGRCPECGEAVG